MLKACTGLCRNQWEKKGLIHKQTKNKVQFEFVNAIRSFVFQIYDS